MATPATVKVSILGSEHNIEVEVTAENSRRASAIALQHIKKAILLSNKERTAKLKEYDYV